MGIYEFNVLSEQNQYEIVFTKGTFVDSIINGNKKFVLYSVHMFWVEIMYEDSINKITGLKSFLSGDILNKYSNVANHF